ncbi:hypothetical protein EXN66_Car013587 [Channa argus]|uniref:Uncharacterized protein n=1 Tax=Channa argus TaxID=215402 RepID=A0A6G1Q6W2_CHAAH|nr:hypothetical protein EXN66_Car013587 [Channa argus]
MFLNLTLFSRLLFVSGLVCAAVVSLFVCSASKILIPVDNGVKHNALRSLNSPPLLTAPLSTETGLRTGTNSETEMSENYREALSITGHKSNLLQFSHDRNLPGNKQSATGIIRAQRGHGSVATWPASSTFTSHFQYGGQSFERPLSNKELPQREAGSSFYQGFSPFWPHDNFQNPYNKDKNPRVYSGDEKVPSVSSLLSSQTSGYWFTPLPKSWSYHRSYEDTHDHTGGGIQSSEFLGFASQTGPRAPAVSRGLETSVTESSPSPKKLTSAITHFSQGLSSVSSREKQGYKDGKSLVFKDSVGPFGVNETIKRVTVDQASISFTKPHDQWASAEQSYSKLYSNLKKLQQTQRERLPFNNLRPLYHNVVLYSPLTNSLSKNPSLPAVYSTAQTPTRHPSHLVSAKTLEGFAPMPQTDPQQSYAFSNEKPVIERPSNTVKGASVYNYKPGQSPQNLYSFRGFKNPPWRAVKEPSHTSFDYRNSQPYNFDKGQDYRGKTHIKFAFLSPKYKFGLREAFTPKRDLTTIDSFSSSPGILHGTQTTTVSAPGSTTSSYEVQSEYYASRDSIRNLRPLQISKKMYDLKTFSSPPLEGGKDSATLQDKSQTLQQDFEGFELGSSRIWQPKSSGNHRWYSQTGEKVQKNVSTQSLNMPQVSNVGSAESVKTSRFSPDKYKRSKNTYAFVGFQLFPNTTEKAKIHWKNTKPNPNTEPTTRVFLSSFGPAGGLELESSPLTEPTTPSKNKPDAKKARPLSRITSRTVRGKHRKKLHTFTSLHNDTVTVSIVRFPKPLVRVKAVPYTDILGSASFSGIKAKAQAPTTASDKDNFPNTTATAQHKENPEANVEDFGSVEDEKQRVKSEEGDSGRETFDAFFGRKGSRRGGFNLSDVLSTDATKTQALGEDLLELNYLQKSTGNISFKSMKLSHSDK